MTDWLKRCREAVYDADDMLAVACRDDWGELLTAYETLLERVAVLEWGLAQLVLEGEDAAFDPLQDRLKRCGIMPTKAAIDAAKEATDG